MPISIKKLTGEAIVVLTYTNPFSSEDMVPVFVQVGQLADETNPLYVINDLSQLSINFGSLASGMSEASTGGPGTAADPRTPHFLVSADALMQIASEGMKQEQYGGMNVPIFATLQEALDNARSQLN